MKYMEEASVFVAPIRVARGVQNKVLEAMACGVPVVATSAAANGLEAVEDKDFLLADSPDRFAEQTVTLLRDNRLREGLIRSAIEYIRQKHDWTSNINKMEDILVNVAELTN
jgi:glycosyltransferase involved in cell wall biosynthesis